MLDLNDPHSKYIFAAARLEDAILNVAKRIIAARPSERVELLRECEEILASMHRLAVDHFAHSHSLPPMINELHDALRALAESGSPDFRMISPALSRLSRKRDLGHLQYKRGLQRPAGTMCRC